MSDNLATVAKMYEAFGRGDGPGMLACLADDVKCKHGSTTGQLDPVALFYLRSRGIAEDQARSLLTYAFSVYAVAALWTATPAARPPAKGCSTTMPRGMR